MPIGAIENGVNAPQKRSAERRQAVREQFVQSVALIDAANFHAPAFVSSVHMDSRRLFEIFAEIFVELLLQPFEHPCSRSATRSSKGVRTTGDRLYIARPPQPRRVIAPTVRGAPGRPANPDPFRASRDTVRPLRDRQNRAFVPCVRAARRRFGRRAASIRRAAPVRCGPDSVFRPGDGRTSLRDGPRR